MSGVTGAVKRQGVRRTAALDGDDEGDGRVVVVVVVLVEEGRVNQSSRELMLTEGRKVGGAWVPWVPGGGRLVSG
jgi:hypothetical protein